jgi:TonB family protein
MPRLSSPHAFPGVIALARTTRLLGAWIWIAGAASIGATDPAAPAPTQPARVISQVEPVYPEMLRLRGVAGSAEILCDVDRAGIVTAAAVAGATLPEFGESALAAVRRWRFSPARRDGVAVAGQLLIPIEFTLSHEPSLESLAGRKVFRAIDAPIVPAESLPAWPAVIRRAWPIYPDKLKGSGITGSAVVSFVIDPEGLPINPEVIQATNDAFIPRALAAAVNLAYRPITAADGKPIFVNLIVKFEFKEQRRGSTAGLIER